MVFIKLRQWQCSITLKESDGVWGGERTIDIDVMSHGGWEVGACLRPGQASKKQRINWNAITPLIDMPQNVSHGLAEVTEDIGGADSEEEAIDEPM